jgi:hypothetical protein
MDVALTRGDGGSDAPFAPDGDVDADAEITRPDSLDARDATDAPNDAAVCGETVPCCPEDLNNTGGQSDVTIRYPAAIVRELDDTFVDTGMVGLTPPAVHTFDATWGGVTQQTPAAEQYCAPRFQTTPPSIPCVADTVIQLDRAGMSPVRFLVSLPMAELSTRTVGENVQVRLEGGSTGDDNLLSVQTPAGVPIVVAASIIEPTEHDYTWTFGPFTVTRSDTPFCIAAPMPVCGRIFEADDLVVTAEGSTYRIHPTETVMVTTASGRYRITHRKIVRRIYLQPLVGCADLRPDVYSFEIVRLGD